MATQKPDMERYLSFLLGTKSSRGKEWKPNLSQGSRLNEVNSLQKSNLILQCTLQLNSGLDFHRTGRFILMKLFNNTTEEQREKELCKEEHKEEDPLNSWFPVARDATISSTTLPPLRPPTRIPPIDDMAGDPLRFDALEDEIPDNHDSSTSSQDDPEHENVDVQAILFYGYTGRRIFPSVKAL